MKIDELKIEHSYGHKLTSKCIGFDSANRPILTLISDEEEKEVEDAPQVEEKTEEATAEVAEETKVEDAPQVEEKKPVTKKPTAKKKPTSKKKK